MQTVIKKGIISNVPSGYHMEVPLLVQMCQEIPSARTIKLEGSLLRRTRQPAYARPPTISTSESLAGWEAATSSRS